MTFRTAIVLALLGLGAAHAQTFPLPITPEGPVSGGDTLQTNPEIAAGVNGFAVTWAEAGLDGAAHIYVRRFTPAGVSQDAAPLLVQTLPVTTDAVPFAYPQIASNDETYVIGWKPRPGEAPQPPGFAFRRLDARTGSWIDSQPVLLPDDEMVDLASNGTDALAVTIRACPPARCLVTTRIPMSGEPPREPVFSAHASSTSDNPRIASNGSDYLAVWNDPVVCFGFPCLTPSFQVYAVRLGTDGTMLDPGPLALDNGKRYPYRPTVAWGGGRYLAAWNESNAVFGLRMTSEGAVVDGAAGEGGVMFDYAADAVHATGFNGRLALIIGRGLNWEGMAFAADAQLATVVALPRTVVSITANRRYGAFAAAPRGGILGVAYSRVDNAGEWRVFLRLFADPPRRRAAGRS
jgi:hypothetical protein